MSSLSNASKIQVEKFKEVMGDPVKWAQVFISIFNPITRKEEPWVARWYQQEMLRDSALKKVYRCGRRTGLTKAHLGEIDGKVLIA